MLQVFEYPISFLSRRTMGGALGQHGGCWQRIRVSFTCRWEMVPCRLAKFTQGALDHCFQSWKFNAHLVRMS